MSNYDLVMGDNGSDDTIGFLGRSGLGKKIATAGTIIAVLTGVMGFANQAELAEPHWIASRNFVRDSIAQATSSPESRQITTQIYLANSERSRLENELANKQVLLDQNPTMPQGIRDSISEQIRALRRELEFTRNQLDDLRRDQATRRP